MALSAGTRLGPYEILAPLGAGGMGEVYRARDTRLDRTVAVKVLPAELAADPQLKARFEREARAISALAHPNICTLHDVGEQDGRTFLVMEHLVGLTLAERLEKGALPLDQALEIATQVADALSAAHKQGIVHRDLKPGNVMLTKTGARLLDFGLARLTGHGELPAVESLTSAPTQPAPLTGQGTILGTLPYMAPEQVEGKPADVRTDIWALGLILYEMVTGERAFQASSPVSLVGAILEREPAPLKERQPLTPPSLERLVRRCLAKDPDDRWDTAHDVADELRWIAETVQQTEAREPARGTPRWMAAALLAAMPMAILAGVLAERLWLRSAESSRTARIIRSQIDLTAERPLRSPWGGNHPVRTELALSPDGTLLVWASRPEDDPTEWALYLRRLETGAVERIPGTERAHQPLFSPDGRWIAFCAWEGRSKTRLRKVPVEGGGLAVDLAELPWWPEGGSWGPDGRIFLGSPDLGIHWVTEDGGLPQEVTTVDHTRETGHRLPSVLPDGDTLLLTTLANAYRLEARVEAVSLSSGERKVLIEDAADARYLPTGHLVFARRGVLMAAPFDPRRLELTAPPAPVVEGVSQALGSGRLGNLGNSGAAQFAASASGLLAYAAGGLPAPPPVELLLVDEGDRSEPVPGFDKPLVSPQVRFSPDGRVLAFVEQAPAGLLWLFDVERFTYRALSEGGIAASPAWSPNGTRLVVTWSESGPFGLWLVSPARGDWERLTSGHTDWAPSWSPDGQILAFVRGDNPLMDIFLYRFDDQHVEPFLATPARETHPVFSPDGRWLAYVSNESGRSEVYVTSFPERERTLTVSQQGGFSPAWSRDGRRLFYHTLGSPDGVKWMMEVDVRHDPELSLGRPTGLFKLPERHTPMWPMRGYEPHPDGRRFIVGRRVETDPPPPVTRLKLVHNWFAELERLAPVD